MGLTAVVAALRAHVAVERVAMVASCRLSTLYRSGHSEQGAAAAEAIDALLVAMRVHPHVADMQQCGCSALISMSCGYDAAAVARKEQALEAGAAEVVVAAMWTHAQAVDVQHFGCFALASMCSGKDALVAARHLILQGLNVDLYLCFPIEQGSVAWQKQWSQS